MIQRNFIYFNERLTRKLNMISRKPMTVVCAPAAAGKSTAVKSYLDNLNCISVWHAVSGEDTERFLRDFAAQLCAADKELGKAVEASEKPYSPAGIAAAMKRCRPFKPLIYVLEYENETNIYMAGIADFIYQLICCRIPDFYTVIISRSGVFGDPYRLTDDRVNVISDADFILTPEEIAAGFKRHITPLIPEEAALIYRCTAGRITGVGRMFSQIQDNGRADTWKAHRIMAASGHTECIKEKDAGEDISQELKNAIRLILQFRFPECGKKLDSLEFSPAFAGRYEKGSQMYSVLTVCRSALKIFSGQAERGICELENILFEYTKLGEFAGAEELSRGSLALKLILEDEWMKDAGDYCIYTLNEMKYSVKFSGGGSFAESEKLFLMSMILLCLGYFQGLITWLEALNTDTDEPDGNRMPEAVKHLMLSIAYVRSGEVIDKKKVQSCFSKAMEIFEKADMILPLLLFYDELRPFMETERRKGIRAVFYERARSGLNAYRRNMRRNYKEGNKSVRGVELTERQSEIAALMEQRLTNKEIALRLNISENTVKTTAKLIFRKLGIKSRKELH